MCGIHAVIEVFKPGDTEGQSHGIGTLPPALCSRLCRRGPDHLGRVEATSRPRKDGTAVRLELTSTVLALRGDGLTKQPFVETGNESSVAGVAQRVLCWNGEVWRVDGAAASIDGNDGQLLFDRLTDTDTDTDDVLGVMRAVEGPFAFVYYDGARGRLYYGRDRLGRRSLLQQTTASGRFVLSSVSDAAEGEGEGEGESPPLPWTEVEADGIYEVDLHGEDQDRPWTVVRHNWSNKFAGDSNDVVSGIGRFNMASDPGDSEPLSASTPSVVQLGDQLTESMRLRILHVPRPPRTTTTTTTTTTTMGASQPSEVDTRVAVLFSGGLDCTVLARIAHDLLPPDQGIDLINVAFENPRVKAHLAEGKDVFEACPDRVTGRASLVELQTTCPSRSWRFLAVNVPYADFVAHRPTVVALMHPHDTEMDLSIASALYFASRGRTDAEETPARVLLSGLGADELFGGYGRHAVAYKVGAAGATDKGGRRTSGYAALARELHMDVARLGRRNLGRDDRVLAHWGREVRFPFLDEQLVRWAIALPVWAKCDFEQASEEENVEPAKRVLRLLAQRLGLSGVAREKKRAVSHPFFSFFYYLTV